MGGYEGILINSRLSVGYIVSSDLGTFYFLHTDVALLGKDYLGTVTFRQTQQLHFCPSYGRTIFESFIHHDKVFCNPDVIEINSTHTNINIPDLYKRSILESLKRHDEVFCIPDVIEINSKRAHINISDLYKKSKAEPLMN